MLHLSDLHFVRRDRGKAAFLASCPRPTSPSSRGLPGRARGGRDRVAAVRARPRSAGVVVRARARTTTSPRGRSTTSRTSGGSGSLAGPRRGRAGRAVAQLAADGWEDLTNVRRRRRAQRARDRAPRSGRRAYPLARPAGRSLGARPTVRVRRDALTGLGAGDRRARLRLHGRRPHARRSGLPSAGVGRLVTNCSLPGAVGERPDRMGEAVVNVSPGLGTSKFAPFRFFCRPEATLLELHPRPGDRAKESTQGIAPPKSSSKLAGRFRRHTRKESFIAT